MMTKEEWQRAVGSMTEDRFSLRYGYEKKPEQPIFDEAPKRLRFFIVKSFQNHFHTHEAMQIIAEVLCRPELITSIRTPLDLWTVIFSELGKSYGWEVYNLIEPLFAELVKRNQCSVASRFANDLNELFGQESIGWKLQNGKLERTLPTAAHEQVDTVFKELENPRFAPALTHIIAAYKAYNARPQRGLDVCSNAFDGCESVAKEIFSMPTATFGDVLKEARSCFAPETISTLEKISALAHNHFRHGMTKPFALTPSEVDFVYLTCLGAILLFVRLR
jgi:AbiJ N-terminal domain 4